LPAFDTPTQANITGWRRLRARKDVDWIYRRCADAVRRTALAQDKEPAAVFQLGAAGQWGLPNGDSSFGPAAAIEFTPIKNWLEIEPGVTSLFSRGQTEWDTDVLFKKPFELSPTFEIEPGIGPQWIHTLGAGRTTDAIATEAGLDFMFWSTRERKVGWFLEPSDSYNFSKGQQSLGVSVGLLLRIHRGASVLAPLGANKQNCNDTAAGIVCSGVGTSFSCPQLRASGGSVRSQGAHQGFYATFASVYPIGFSQRKLQRLRWETCPRSKTHQSHGPGDITH
jgi:hypothetical protein